MTRQFPFRTFLTIATVMILSTASSVAAQPLPPEGVKSKPEKELSDAEKEIRRAAEQLVNGFDLEILKDDKWTKVKRIEKPLLFFGDSTRGIDRGSLWAWGEKGRPVAVLELFQDTIRRQAWVCSFCKEFDDKEVFAGPRGGPLSGANKPYFNTRIYTKLDSDPMK
jgi:hypothetical protein